MWILVWKTILLMSKSGLLFYSWIVCYSHPSTWPPSHFPSVFPQINYWCYHLPRCLHHRPRGYSWFFLLHVLSQPSQHQITGTLSPKIVSVVDIWSTLAVMIQVQATLISYLENYAIFSWLPNSWPLLISSLYSKKRFLACLFLKQKSNDIISLLLDMAKCFINKQL